MTEVFFIGGNMITIERVNELLKYEPETGFFIRKITRNQLSKKGTVAGSVSKGGPKRNKHVKILIDGKLYQAHRLAWFVTYGYFPKQIDHINRNPTDNRISNLRECTISENNKNKAACKNNKSGFKGVYKYHSKWRAQIRKDNVQICIGSFATPELAHAAYVKASLELYPNINGGL